MATKIGYVRRDPSENINWAEVGANFSGMLQEEARVREEKKAEIDRATREMENVLKNSPMGDSKNMNEWSLDFASDAQSQLLMTNALLKNGQLKPKDYTVIRQNLADGTDQAFTLQQEYQNEFAEKMARAKAKPGSTIGPDGKPIVGAQALETFLMGTAEGFGNFTKSKLMISPTTGKVMVGFMGANGEIEKDPSKLVGINNLRNRIKGKIDAYDMDTAIADAKAGAFGAFSVVSNNLGGLYQKGTQMTANGPQLRNASGLQELVKQGVMTAEEAKLLSDIQTTENSWAESQLSNSYNISSLLTNNLGGLGPNGKPYTFTDNPADEDENTILLTQIDGQMVPDFDSDQGKKHREAAKSGLINRMRGALDIEVKGQVVGGNTPPAPPDPGRGDRLKAQQSFMGNVAKLYYGTPQEIDEAGAWLRSQNPDIASIDRAGTDVIIVYADGHEEPLKFNDGNGGVLSQEQWVKGNANFFLPVANKITDIDKTWASSGADPSRGLNTTYSKEYSGTISQTEGVEEAFTRILTEKKGFAPSVLVADDEDKTKTNLQAVLKGVPASSNWTVDIDYDNADIVKIYNDKQELVMQIDLDGMTAEGQVNAMKQLKNNIAAATDAPGKSLLIGKDQKTTSKPTGKSSRKRTTAATPATQATTQAPT
mgnify:CR=1 FL=1|tara:strand:- start:130 stop:2091 length:1962 start_codon:yes stop_codon:yes gene_type:complete